MDFDEQLLDAVDNDDPSAIFNIVSQFPDDRAQLPILLENAVIHAVRSGAFGAVDMLLNCKASPHAVSSNGNSALMLSIYAGNMEIFSRLLSAKADPTHRNQQGDDAMLFCATKGTVELLEKLLECGCSSLPNRAGTTAVIAASCRGHTAVLARLLRDHAHTVNLVPHEGLPALHAAAKPDHGDCVRLLLEAKALVSLPSKLGKTPLSVATGESRKILMKAMEELERSCNAAAEELLAELHPKSKKEKKPQKQKQKQKPSMKETTVDDDAELNIASSAISDPPTVDMTSDNADADSSDWQTAKGKKTKVKSKNQGSVEQKHDRTLETRQMPTSAPLPEKKAIVSSKNVIVSTPLASRITTQHDPVSMASTPEAADLKYVALQGKFEQLHPHALDLSLSMTHLLGEGLEDLSISQLEAVEDICQLLLKKINAAKIEYVRRQERERLENRWSLELDYRR